jgi:hypothetical protein
MRIVVQQKTTGLYFQDIDSWSRTSAEAMDFVCSSAAIDFCVANKLKDMQIVLKFEEQAYDIVLPVVALDDFSRERGPARRAGDAGANAGCSGDIYGG